MSEKRDSGDNLGTTEITGGKSIVQFFNISGFSDTDVIDIYFSKFTQDMDYFEITFFLTGSYESYSLKLNDNNTVTEITVGDNITAQIEGIFDNGTDYKCEYLNEDSWSTDGCNVEKVDDNYVILSLEHLSTFRIQEDDSSKTCDVGAGPIATMSVTIFLMIFLSIIFILSDAKTSTSSVTNSFLLLYPLTTIFIQQPKSRRAVLAMQILTSELLMLTLIGAFTNHFDGPESKTDNGFDNYYGFQLSRGAAAWALTQAFTIPIFILNAYTLKGKSYHMITIPVCIFITLGCFCGLVVMTHYYCLGWTEYWIANWLIFLLFDIATLEIIYALTLSCFIKIDSYQTTEKDSPKKETKKESSSSDDNIATRRPQGKQDESDDYEIIADPV